MYSCHCPTCRAIFLKERLQDKPQSDRIRGQRDELLITSILRDIYRTNLGVKKHETVLVFTDRISDKEDISEADRERRTKLASLALLTVEIGKTFCKTKIFCISRYRQPWCRTSFGSLGARIRKRTVETLKKKRLLTPILKKTAETMILKRPRTLSENRKMTRLTVWLRCRTIPPAIQGSGIS